MKYDDDKGNNSGSSTNGGSGSVILISANKIAITGDNISIIVCVINYGSLIVFFFIFFSIISVINIYGKFPVFNVHFVLLCLI